MTRCVFSLRARADLRRIHAYIAERDPDIALDLITRLTTACEDLATMPEKGRKRDELALGLRSWPVDRYIIFYRIGREQLRIVRVLHGARLPTIVQEGERLTTRVITDSISEITSRLWGGYGEDGLR